MMVVKVVEDADATASARTSIAGFTLLMAAGSARSVAEFFRGMPEKERRTYVKPLKNVVRSVGWNARVDDDWRDFNRKHQRVARTAVPAAMAVFPSAATTAKFLRSLQRSALFDAQETAVIRQVLADRAPAWLPDLPAALLETLDVEDAYDFVEAVRDVAGVELAASPQLVRAWGTEYRWKGDDTTLQARLLRHPRLAEFLPLLFDDDENDDVFSRWSAVRAGAPMAVSQGLVPRDTMLDASLRRLLRGGRPGAMTDHLALWTALEPTDAEIVERVSSCISLLSSQSGTVARTFLTALKHVSDAGLIDVELAVEAASVAVTRPEKNIVKTTLGWLDALVAAHPDRAGQIAATVAIAFGAQAADLQERAVKLVAKHAKRLAEDERGRLAAEAQVYLAPDLAATLAGLLGVSQDSSIGDVAYPDVAPYVPRPLLPPIASPAELAEVVAGLMQADPVEAMVFERVLEAFVVFERTDPAALQAGLAPVVERWMADWSQTHQTAIPRTPRTMVEMLAVVAAGAVDDARRHPHRAGVNQLWSRVRKSGRGWWNRTRTTPADFLVLRAAEVTAALGMPDLPPLLAVPTSPTGAIEPVVLAARLRECEANGWEPLQADFHQALLRLPEDCGDVDVSGLTSKAGRRFAEWAAGKRIALPVVEMPDPRVREQSRKEYRSHYLKRATRGHVATPQTLLDLAPGIWREPERCWDGSEWAVCWPAIVPSRPDLAAVAMAGGVDWTTAPAAVESAVVLAEQEGSQGATHQLIAARLVHDDVRLRASGVDAALVLAARGVLDPPLLSGALAAELAAVPPGLRRVVPGLRDLANGGAAGAAWEATALLLPGILPPAVPKTLSGTADLLVLATELAGALKVRTPIAEVGELARKKSGSAVTNAARRLAAALGAE